MKEGYIYICVCSIDLNVSTAIFNIPERSETKDKMNYEDFVWFMLSEEDKTTLRSLQYWFKVIDLDDNQIITPHEMEHFYEE